MLNQALADNATAIADETLTATILLSFYEMVASDIDVPWIKHAGGSGTLIKLRGPERHRTGLGREILPAYRHTLITEALSPARASFLDEPEWRDLFRYLQEDVLASGMASRNVEVYLPTEQFIIEMARLPALIADIRDIPREHRNQESTINVLKTRAKDWRADMDRPFTALGNALSDIGCPPTVEFNNDSLFMLAYRYINVYFAAVYTIY